MFARSGVSANNARTSLTNSSTLKSIRAPSSNKYEISAMEASCVNLKRLAVIYVKIENISETYEQFGEVGVLQPGRYVSENH